MINRENPKSKNEMKKRLEELRKEEEALRLEKIKKDLEIRKSTPTYTYKPRNYE